jgi:hypothetical protein
MRFFGEKQIVNTASGNSERQKGYEWDGLQRSIKTFATSFIDRLSTGRNISRRPFGSVNTAVKGNCVSSLKTMACHG